jgi:hypothetical protein
MLTDIFARRYANYPIWSRYTENEPKLLQQCIDVAKDVLPYHDSAGKISEYQKLRWKTIHDQLARELGLRELWPRYFTSKWQGNDVSYTNEWVTMCEYFVTSRYVPPTLTVDGLANPGHGSVDRYMKERLSLIELVMRKRQDEINEMNRTLEERVKNAALDALLRSSRSSGARARIPHAPEAEIRAQAAAINKTFNDSVNELNVRFQQAGVPLSYHNGFIQVAKDEQIEKQVAKPFWDAIADPKWANVETDMHEALDRRDNGAGDAAWYACKALESAIKIISDLKGWTTGNERGAGNYIEHLVVERGGVRFIDTFETEVLKSYFKHVRNPFGHGPGKDPMPNFTAPQTDWTIEFAMTWIRTLVRRS